MNKIAEDLLNFMLKWSGKSGGLILVNILKQIGIKNLSDMTMSEKEKLMTALTRDYLATFLARSRFLMARAELVSILGISEDSYIIHDQGARGPPRSPDLWGETKA
jgi:hypothetical protein